MDKRVVLALAKMIVAGRVKERKKLKLCGSCVYFDFKEKRCALQGRCCYAQVSRESGPYTAEYPGRGVIKPKARGKVIREMDPIHLRGEEPLSRREMQPGKEYEVRPTGKLWSELFPQALSEDRRNELWNRHITVVERAMENLLRDDAWRRAMESILDSYGVEYNQDEELEFAADESVEEIDEEVAEEKWVLSHVQEAVEYLTKQLKEYT